MSTYTYQSGSIEYLDVRVAATRSGSAYDPSGGSVELAFAEVSTSFDPATASWHAGSWYTSNGRHFAQLLLGSGGVVLAEGSYQIYVRIGAAPEDPVKRAGLLRVV